MGILTKTHKELYDPSHSVLFEYASELVREFIETEKTINHDNLDKLFDDDSWLCGFFNCNLNQLSNATAFNSILKMLKQNDTNYNPQLARVTSLYSTICMGCGKAHVERLADYLAYSITSDNSSGSLTENKKQVIREAIRNNPILIISAIGNSYFGRERVKYIKSRTT